MVAMALVMKDKLYYRELEKNETVTFGADKTCDEIIHGIKRQIRVKCRNNDAQIWIANSTMTANNMFHQSGSAQELTARMGEITVVDYENQISVLFAPVSQSDKHIYFDNNDIIRVGRIEKKARDGSENSIVLNLPFVSSRHMEFISQNGKLVVRDNGSLNGTFVNGEKVIQKEIHPGDVISILTIRMVYDGNSLSFFTFFTVFH